MNLYKIEWWYADGHGETTMVGTDDADAIARFGRSFRSSLPIAYRRAVATLVAEDV